MKGKLSALKYVLNNKKQVWVMIISLALTFMTMYVIHFLFLSTSESMSAILVEQPKKMAMVKLTQRSMGLADRNFETEEEFTKAYDQATNEICERLKQHEGIENAFFSQGLGASYQGIVGGYFYDFPMLSPEQIPEYLEHFDAKLIEGRLPENDGEMLVAEKVMRNKKMKLNGYFLEKTFGTNFTVVGVLKSDDLICVGTPRGYWNTGWYFTVLCDEKHSEMKEIFSDIGYPISEDDTVYDRVTLGEDFREDILGQLNTSLLAILIVVIVFLAISVLTAYVSFLRNRVNEYCLYASIGYGRKEIYGMVMREILIIFGTGIILGVIVTVLILWGLAHFLLDPLGLLYRYFYPEHLFNILAAFVSIIGVLQLPVVITIKNIKTIDLIEE